MPFPQSETVGAKTFEQVDVKSLLRENFVPGMQVRNEGEVARNVLLADPTDEASIPCIAINRADDQETEVFLADLFEESPHPTDSNAIIRTEGSYWGEVVELRVWAFNPDERDQLYQKVKQILIDMRISGVFESAGLKQVKFTGGHDAMSSDYFGRPVYWAPIHMSCLNPLMVKQTISVISSITVQSLEGVGANGNVTNQGTSPAGAEPVGGL
jgi:hypothetical protein